MAKLTLEDKRRQSIYRQLYGKQTVSLPKQKETETQAVSLEKQNVKLPTGKEMVDSKYLTMDLLKVLILSSLALAIQLSLFFAQRNHLVNLNF